MSNCCITRKWEIMCRYFLGNKCDKMWNKIENEKDVKDRKWEKMWKMEAAEIRKDVKYRKMENRKIEKMEAAEIRNMCWVLLWMWK